ncbi:uncharacterized protein LOC143023544 [Oratosquilla oratoria]|uniref:uncharacterized protein LOC143023544 n=1 Tax=Oratosquilla oratoria TaxID=337810 RepID=UPI003F769BEE
MKKSPFSGVAGPLNAAPGDAAGKTASSTPNKRLLGIEHAPRRLNFFELLKLVTPFGTVERISLRVKSNYNFYMRFLAPSECIAASVALNGNKIADSILKCSILKISNIEEQDDDFIPNDTYLTPELPERPHPYALAPVYNLATVEEGSNDVLIFNMINKMIANPPLTPETFTRFGRNTYLVKVRSHQGFMLQGTSGDFYGSGILKISPYDGYNGSKGKIFNSSLISLPTTTLLNMCPQNVLDTHVVSKYSPEEQKFVPTPLIIIKFSDPNPPDVIVIGPHRCTVRSYVQSPRTCTCCLRYSHSSKICGSPALCRNCAKPSHVTEGECCDLAPTCAACNGAHCTFSKECEEHSWQRLVSETAYNNRTSFRGAAAILRGGQRPASYASATKTSVKANPSLLPSSSHPDATSSAATVPAQPSQSSRQSTSQRIVSRVTDGNLMLVSPPPHLTNTSDLGTLDPVNPSSRPVMSSDRSPKKRPETSKSRSPRNNSKPSKSSKSPTKVYRSPTPSFEKKSPSSGQSSSQPPMAQSSANSSSMSDFPQMTSISTPSSVQDGEIPGTEDVVMKSPSNSTTSLLDLPSLPLLPKHPPALSGKKLPQKRPLPDGDSSDRPSKTAPSNTSLQPPPLVSPRSNKKFTQPHPIKTTPDPSKKQPPSNPDPSSKSPEQRPKERDQRAKILPQKTPMGRESRKPHDGQLEPSPIGGRHSN